jgi:hypothetical protein
VHGLILLFLGVAELLVVLLSVPLPLEGNWLFLLLFLPRFAFLAQAHLAPELFDGLAAVSEVFPWLPGALFLGVVFPLDLILEHSLAMAVVEHLLHLKDFARHD